jgi:hypothetical protein
MLTLFVLWYLFAFWARPPSARLTDSMRQLHFSSLLALRARDDFRERRHFCLLLRSLPSLDPIVQVVAKYAAVLSVNLVGSAKDYFNVFGLPAIGGSGERLWRNFGYVESSLGPAD